MKGLIFTYLTCYGGSVVALFRPWYGLLIYVGFSILRPADLWWWEVPRGNYSRTVAIALLIGWAASGFGSWRLGRAWPVVAAAFGFWLWSVLAAVAAPNQEIAWAYVDAKSKVILPLIAGVTLIDSVAQIRQLFWTIAASVGYVAFECNLAYLNGHDFSSYGFLNLDNNVVCLQLLAGIGLGFFLAESTRNWLLKAISLLIALGVAHTCMFSMSRGAMVGMVATAGAAFVLIPKTPKHYVVLALALLAGLRLMGKEVTEEFVSSFADEEHRDGSAQSRVDLWKACIDVAQQSPILGCGPGNFPEKAVEYGFPPGKQAHSTWFQALAELGVPGAGFLMGMYAILMWRLWSLLRRYKAFPNDWRAVTARALIASLFGVLVGNSFVTAEGMEVPYYLTMTGAAALKLDSLWSANHSNGADVPSPAEPPCR